MTTMTTRLTAPRIGYLLTAAMAGHRYGEAADMWRELDEFTQLEVIGALSAQARLAVAEAGVPLQVDFTALTDPRCPEAVTAARSAYEGADYPGTDYPGTVPWQLPRCLHCRELVASSLAEIQLQAGIAAGMPPSYVDLICRGKAVSGAA
jgi:hypothetical protein